MAVIGTVTVHFVQYLSYRQRNFHFLLKGHLIKEFTQNFRTHFEHHQLTAHLALPILLGTKLLIFEVGNCATEHSNCSGITWLSSGASK